jgi:hypothetical protein
MQNVVVASRLMQLSRSLKLKRIHPGRAGRAPSNRGGQAVTQEEAKRQIYNEWRKWAEQHNAVVANGTTALIFYQFLRQERSYLLEFTAHGDKWQVVHGWLLQANLVSDQSPPPLTSQI